MYYLVSVVKRAWQHSLLEVLLKSCKKSCISSAVDKTVGDMLWKCSEEDENVRSECEEDRGTDW